MRMMSVKAAVLAATALLPLAVAPAQAATAQAARHADGPAYFEFTDGVSHNRFVVRLTNEEKIQEARDILSGKEQERVHVMGRIIKRPAPYNRPWTYQLDPNSVQFFAYAIEVCDASIGYTEEHLDEAGGPFLPGLYWCPWGSRLLRELPAE